MRLPTAMGTDRLSLIADDPKLLRTYSELLKLVGEVNVW